MMLECREEYAQLLRWAGVLNAGCVVNAQKFVSFSQFKREFRRMTHCVSPASACPEPFISKQEGFCSEVEV